MSETSGRVTQVLDLDQLKNRRSSVEAKLSIFSDFINNLETLYPNRKITDVDTIFELEQRYEQVQRFLFEFDEVQTAIEQVMGTDIQSQLPDRKGFETSYYKSMGTARHFLTIGATLTNQIANNNETDSRSMVGSARDSSNNQSIKLPTIKLPTFNGDSNEWLGFRDTFESLIHSRSDISDIQKFHYLKSAAGAKVLEIIQNLEFSSENYHIAWNILCERFNNPDILIENHIKAIYFLEKNDVESSYNLRKILDIVTNRLRALQSLKEPVHNWGKLLIFLIAVKLDENTSEKWNETKIGLNEITFEKFIEFLKTRANILESKEKGKMTDSKPTKKAENRPNKIRTFVTSNSNGTPLCSYCGSEHYINNCEEFLKLSKHDRLEKVKRKGLCINCLKSGHLIKQCRLGPCRICRIRHHTLLHFDRSGFSNFENKNESNVHSEANAQQTVALSSKNIDSNHVLLSTISIRVFNKNKSFLVRALLDVGSQSSFITTELSNILQLDQVPCNLKIESLNETFSEVKQKCYVQIHSRSNSFSMNISCLVVPQITGNLPNFRIDPNSLKIPENIQLADPNFHLPDKVHILIGAGSFWDIISVGQIKLGEHGPVLQKSKFGWIVSGCIQGNAPNTIKCNFSKNIEIDKQLSRFWEIEEFPNTKILSPEEKLVEEHFLENFRRDIDGRFIVSIPLKASSELLGYSRETARKRFLNLEKKFDRDPRFKVRYQNFIKEYIDLGHMVKIDKPDLAKISYYMPHHGILKETSLSTKLRVVFDSSCPTDTGYSFNDLQRVGPTIQSDLLSILILFRKHNFVVAGDIEKMYRMCLVEPSQRSLQRILWRDNPTDPLDTYELCTVTYGTSAGAFLAIRCLYQLGLECEDPVISDVIKTQFYVDDMLSGGSTEEEASHIANEVSRILKGGGFVLRKFVSNSAKVLENIESKNETSLMDLGVNENTKTLGMIWNASVDFFSYKIGTNFNSRVTKRTVLAETSQIFDPLGLLSPAIILAKLIMRDIWLEKIDWDHSLTLNLHTRWLQFRDELHYLNNIEIPRRVICSDPLVLEIHGFSDSSSFAYGACVYIRSLSRNRECNIELMCAKSKVAPIKTQTIPRLELLGALLMCKLVEKIKNSIKIKFSNTYYWTDSTIVLGWINTPPNRLQTFVANRVANIQELSATKDWRHVPTSSNPADCVSRGLKPSLLKNHELYWHGPAWLIQGETNWPVNPTIDQALPEIKQIALSSLTLPQWNIFDKFSNLDKIERTIAWCLRFRNNCLKNKQEREVGPLKHHEIVNAKNSLLMLSQRQSFKDEINLLNSKKPLNPMCKILKLNPFLDDKGILRVGGRLSNSNFNYNKKHPALLCSKNRFSRLLFEREHKRLLHAGPQHLLAHIRENYWPLSGRNLSRKIVHECVICFRTKPSSIAPIMGNLPLSRTTPAPPFFTVGVDYAGPIRIKDRQGRGCKITKAYICIFVCFVTRAIHIELVPDLTSNAFIAAFRRFIARRGKPTRIYSDNGTNFVGAHNELQDLGNFLKLNSAQLTETFEYEGISWSFIPAYSPHFGGLWEAGVKSTKYHLFRIAGNALLTFEQLYTLLVQIEGILNSRPISPLSNDPSDLCPLTPAHFLIGRPMTSLVDPALINVPENRLLHYQRIQQLQQHFWARWSLEYISELQVRCKWRSSGNQLKVNDLVVVKEDSLPPFKWSLGRVVQLHPGKDNVARVATIRTSVGLIKRSFARICPLPIDTKC